jgi:rhomboid protease GluP
VSAAKKPTVAERLRASPVTFVFILINVVVFLYAESHGGTKNTGTLLEFGAAEQIHVRAGEYWRLFTPMFLHIGWMHLLWNGYFSVGWCAVIEQALGRWRFIVLYLVSGIGASAVSVACHQVVSAGASGALFGVIGAVLVMRRRMLPSWGVFFRDRPVRSTLVSIAVWTVVGLTVVAMDNFAHLGGLVTGAVVAWLMSTPPPVGWRWPAFAVVLGALVLVAVRPGWRPSSDEAFRLVVYGGQYAVGGTLPRSDRRAAHFLDLACKAHNPFGCAALGFVRGFAPGADPDRAAAQDLLQNACDADAKWACTLKGRP